MKLNETEMRMAYQIESTSQNAALNEIYITWLKEKAGLPNVVFHSLRHSNTTYRLKHMITKVYTHILDEDCKINAQKFESAFCANPDLRNVKPPLKQPQAQTLDLAALISAQKAG